MNGLLEVYVVIVAEKGPRTTAALSGEKLCIGFAHPKAAERLSGMMEGHGD